jgi:phage head maturation protease
LRRRFDVADTPLGQRVLRMAHAGEFRGCSICLPPVLERSRWIGTVREYLEAELEEVSVTTRRPAWYATWVRAV